MLESIRFWLADHLDPTRPAPKPAASVETDPPADAATPCHCHCADQDLVVTARAHGISDDGTPSCYNQSYILPSTMLSTEDMLMCLRYAVGQVYAARESEAE